VERVGVGRPTEGERRERERGREAGRRGEGELQRGGGDGEGARSLSSSAGEGAVLLPAMAMAPRQAPDTLRRLLVHFSPLNLLPNRSGKWPLRASSGSQNPIRSHQPWAPSWHPGVVVLASSGDCVRVELGVSRVAVGGAGLERERERQREIER
jgi:hypothetical protein